jgi:hypothetical protein
VRAVLDATPKARPDWTPRSALGGSAGPFNHVHALPRYACFLPFELRTEVTELRRRPNLGLGRPRPPSALPQNPQN